MTSTESDKNNSTESAGIRTVSRRIWIGFLFVFAAFVMYQIRDVPRSLIAEWNAAAAREAAAADDWKQALVRMEKAIAMHPSADKFAQSCALHHQRAIEARRSGNFALAKTEADRALQDIEIALDKEPSWQWYGVRAAVYGTLDDFRHAVEDWTHYLRSFPDRVDAEAEIAYASGLNGRAYMRALGEFELTEALEDIDKAILMLPDAFSDRYQFLDTKAYLLHLLGRSEDALPLIEESVEAAQARLERQLPAKISEESASRLRTIARESLAVILHHRGEIYEALNRKTAAENDFHRATELGYDPKRGVR